MLTCKEFLAELSDYLDERTESAVRAEIEAHLTKCPNCWVVCDTTRKTIQVFKGLTSCDIPQDVHVRLMAAVERKIAAKKATN